MEDLQKQINELKAILEALNSANSIPLKIDQALVGRGFIKTIKLTGILKANGNSPLTAITPLSGTKIYYVADSSGGSTTRKLTFVNGVLTAEI